MDDRRAKLIARIAKLLAVTVERGATPAEAETAADAARQLMDAYGIGEKDIGRTEALATIVAIDRTYSRIWMKSLCVAIAKRFECQVIQCGRMARVVGFEADAHTAVALYDALITEIRSASRRAYRERMYQPEREDFCCGATTAVCRRLQAIGSGGAPSSYASSKNALVIRDAIEDVVHAATGGRTKRVRAKRGSRHGMDFGKNVSLETNQIVREDQGKLV